MTDAAKMALAIRHELPNLIGGTLRFWGEWFGRPYDNWHEIVDADAQGTTLHVHFNEGERLSIFHPVGLSLSSGRLRVEDAESVRWEWHFYGRPKTPEHLCVMDFEKAADRVEGTSNFVWQSKTLRSFVDFPAVEIL